MDAKKNKDEAEEEEETGMLPRRWKTMKNAAEGSNPRKLSSTVRARCCPGH